MRGPGNRASCVGDPTIQGRSPRSTTLDRGPLTRASPLHSQALHPLGLRPRTSLVASWSGFPAFSLVARVQSPVRDAAWCGQKSCLSQGPADEESRWHVTGRRCASTCQFPVPPRESATLAFGVPLGRPEDEAPSQALRQQGGRIVWLPLTPQRFCADAVHL